jgi:hypothetical protein
MRTLAASTILALAPAAHAQLSIDWHTIDGGGGASSGGGFTLTGTIGQPDAGAMSAGAFACAGGFWAGGAGQPPCYANCDNSTTSPVLNVADFTCFLQRFAAADPYANCDNSTTSPVLNVADFTCFLQRFAAGCA